MTQGRAVIIGAGAVGLAVARLLARKGFETYILESGPRIAEGVTSRNSGVIHSPLNYPSGSLKGSLCARGRELLYEWCVQAQVPHRQVGKCVVATSSLEETELEKIYKAAHSHGATEVRFISAVELQKLEPAVKGAAALFSPRTGIIDPYELSRSFLRDAEENGATLLVNAKVEQVSKQGGAFCVHTSRGPIDADLIINSAGLYADEVSKLAGPSDFVVYPWRGDYFAFNPGPAHRFRHLIYPVKMKSDPGLGVHLTMDLEGRYRLGPDVEFSISKEDFSPKPEKVDAFLQATQKLFPWAKAEMLRYDTCGIRPKLRSPLDREEKDFIIKQSSSNWIDLLGIESPGLTSSMAIAEKVCEKLLSR